MHSLLLSILLVATCGGGRGSSFPQLTLALDTDNSDPNFNFNANFGSSPEPFTIDVDRDFIAVTKLKASLTRYVDAVEQPDLLEGPTKHNVTTVRDYWVDEYDWEQVQAELNHKYTQFTTTVTTGPKGNFTDPIKLHFVHHRSNRTDAIPLLFIHGWPGSFLEVGNIIDGLTNPPNASTPAFHVVAPSIPGFGFSPAPTHTGLGLRAAGQAFNNLMLQLNYPKYVVQGGDFGGVILRFIAGDHPDSVLSTVANFWIIPPNATDYQRYYAGETTPDETHYIEALERFENYSSGFRFIQQTRPLTIAIGMTDSPLGFAMWIYDVMQSAVESYVWTPREIITWTMMYYIQGPYGGMRYYLEAVKEHGWEGFGFGNGYPYVTQPTAISEFPYDLWYREPLDWAQRRGNVVRRTVHDHGSHFAALETPNLLLDDIRSFWGNATLSNLCALGKC